MRISLAWLLALSALPAGVLAQDAPIEQTVHDKPAVRGSIIANLLQDHDNPFLLYPYESNYLLIRFVQVTSNMARKTGRLHRETTDAYTENTMA